MNIDIESLKKHVPEELSVTPIIYAYCRAKTEIEKFKEACREEYRESHTENIRNEKES